MNNILAVMFREYKIRITSMTWMFYDLTLPVFYLLLFGIGLNEAFTGGIVLSGESVDYIDFFLAGVLSMASFGIAINASYGFFLDRENGIFYEFLSYPMSRGEFLFGKILFSACITSLQALFTIMLGALLLGIPILAAFLPLLLLVNIFFTSGWFFFLAIFALRIRRNDFYNTVINVLYFVLMFASSLFFPLETVPPWFKVLASVNPLTWHTDILRCLTIGIGRADTMLIEGCAFALFTLLSFWGGVRALNRSS